MPETLLGLRTRAQGRADMETDANIATTVWNAYINASRQRLRRILVATNVDLFLKSKTFTLTGGNSSYIYDLAANVTDFWKVMALDKNIDSQADNIQRIGRFMFAERFRAIDISYRVFNDALELRPASAAAGNYTLWYIPQPAVMSADGNTLALAEDMWSEFIVLEAAIKARRRQQRDTSDLVSELRELVPEIQSAAADINAGEADRVLDVDGGRWGWRPRLPPP